MSLKVSRPVLETGFVGCIPYSCLGRIRVVTYIAKFNYVKKDKPLGSQIIYIYPFLNVIRVVITMQRYFYETHFFPIHKKDFSSPTHDDNPSRRVVGAKLDSD